MSYKTTYGGNAIRYLSSVRLQMKRGDPLKGPGGQIMGITGKISARKNKVGMPALDVPFGIQHGVGFDNVWAVHTDLVGAKLIQKDGSWFTIFFEGMEEPLRYQGWAQLGQKMVERPEVWEILVNAYRARQPALPAGMPTEAQQAAGGT